MNKIIIGFVSCVVFILTGCGLNQKAQVQALSKFSYSVESVDDMRIAGRPITSFQTESGLSLSNLPGLAIALLNKDLPLEARVNLKIANPTNTQTKINEFKYLIELSGKPIFEGSVNENINLANGQSTVVPLTFKTNLFGVAKEQGIDKVLSDILTRNSDALLALKIKPSIRVGNSNIFYPGYITVDKDLAKGILKVLDKNNNKK